MKVGVYSVRESGSAVLRRPAKRVTDSRAPATRAVGRRLKGALAAFRKSYGFGRAMAAPQLGASTRIVAMDLGKGPFLLLNPEIVWKSPRTFTMWDDCMSFPGLLVKVRRHESVTLTFVDERGLRREIKRAPRALSELLQHELDHLDGVLAIDRALGKRSVITRGEFARDTEFYEDQVDYVIGGRRRPWREPKKRLTRRRRGLRSRASSRRPKGRRSGRTGSRRRAVRRRKRKTAPRA